MKTRWLWSLSSIWLMGCGMTEMDDRERSGTTGHTTADTGPTTTGHPNAPDCPSVEPILLTDCSPAGLECEYHDCSWPDFLPPSRVFCAGGRWERMTLGECELPVCPNDPLILGEVCDPAYFTGTCSHSDGCQNVIPVRCIDGIWQDDGSAATTGTGSGTTGGVLTCPDLPPAVGALCCPAQHTANCNYEAFSTTSGAVAAATGPGGPFPQTPVPPCMSCVEGMWRESTGCN